MTRSAVIYTPATRKTDPQSSRTAENNMNKSGARENQQNMVKHMVEKFPGRTSAELAKLSGKDRSMIARRLPELDGIHIKRGETLEKCKVTGINCVTWWPK